MQIKIEIDVRPEELRRFLGLPDIAGLQEELIEFVRNKVGQASESFDAAAFVKGNLKLLGRNPTLRKLLAAGRRGGAGDAAAPTPAAAAPPRKPRAAARTTAGESGAPAKRARKPRVAPKTTPGADAASADSAATQPPAGD